MKVRRAHTVSKGYIRAWADPKGRVDVADIQHRRGFLTTVESATVVSYAYDPSVITRDLETEYSRIESDGIPAIRKLCEGLELTEIEKSSVVAFLDMHLDRGRYADQTQVRIPAVVLKSRGTVANVELNLADRLLLSRSQPDVTRLAALGLDVWPWHVREANHLATGDGAVLLWRPTEGAGICTASFPLSPSRMLVIGQDPPHDVPFNELLAGNSKRWVLGIPGSLNMSHAAVSPAQGDKNDSEKLSADEATM